MSRRGFSMIEVLTVLFIISIVAALAFSVPRGEKAEAQVRGAADELAAVMRQTRAQAIATRSVYAIAFNIANAPGSSGRVLNNRNGGHWYRVLGPRPGHQSMNQQLAFAPIFDRSISFAGGGVTFGYPNGNGPDNPVRPFLESVEQSWASKVHQLTPGQVRFLALTDEDRGHYRAPGDAFPPTYPRPWFGTWDDAAKRLYPWGGYDPDLPMVGGGGFGSYWGHAMDCPRSKNGRTISHTGFYYEGYDGIITGCVNPSDRMVFDDTNGDGLVSFQGNAVDDLTAKYRLWAAGDSRPLINAAWGDFLLVFDPSGAVHAEWMPMRRAFTPYIWGGACYDPTIGKTTLEDVDQAVTAGKYRITDLGPADRISRTVAPDVPGCHVARSGFYWITLAPDVKDDQDTFTDARAAIRSITPAYRVGVSPFGEVRVNRVRTTATGAPALDTTLAGSDWQNRSKTNANYQRGTLTNADGTLRGSGPSVDRVYPDMLVQGAWWWQ
jgi:prepilin-type N-terminal cleavage/methylation domain-containing protein